MIRVSIIQQQLPMPQVSNSLYPFNTSLEEEMSRLFGYLSIEQRSIPPPHVEDVMADFRLNGRDSEYSPDTDVDMEREVTRRKKKSKKPLPTECVFCRNNGEAEDYYSRHTLKDEDGNVQCPVLRAYTCPICGSSGDQAHTVKYCPKRPRSPTIATANAFKYLRNSMGRRKAKLPSRVLSGQSELSKPYMTSNTKKQSRNFELLSVSAAGR